MKLGKRILEIREKNNIPREKLARASNISTTSLYRIETEQQTPNAEILMKISEALNISSDYLLGLDKIEPYDKQKKIPLINLKENDIYKGSTFNYLSLKRINYALEEIDFVFIKENNDMSPTINMNSYIFVKKEEKIEHGKIYIFKYKNKILVRRIFIDKNSYILKSDNDEIDPKICKKKDIKLIGKIKFVLKELI